MAFTQKCASAIDRYGFFLEDNGYLPVPNLIDSECAGNWLELDPAYFASPTGPTAIPTVFGKQVVSAYSPSGISFEISTDLGKTWTSKGRLLCPQCDPQKNPEELAAFERQEVLMQVKDKDTPHVSLRTLFLEDGGIAAFKVSMCDGERISVGDALGAFFPQSFACDQFMGDYCESPTNVDLPECNCFREQKSLIERVPDTVLPVRCLGPACSFRGYQTLEMKEAGCSGTLCERIIEIHGEDLVDESQNVIYCGYRKYPFGGGTATATATARPKRPSTLGRDLGIFFGIAAAVVAVILLAFYIFKPEVLEGRRG